MNSKSSIQIVTIEDRAFNDFQALPFLKVEELQNAPL